MRIMSKIGIGEEGLGQSDVMFVVLWSKISKGVEWGL